MYRVLASFLGRREDLAYVEHEGKIYLATDWIRGEQRIWRELRPERAELEIKGMIEEDDFVRHTPPIEVKNLEDWPDAVKRAMEQASTSCSPS